MSAGPRDRRWRLQAPARGGPRAQRRQETGASSQGAAQPAGGSPPSRVLRVLGMALGRVLVKPDFPSPRFTDMRKETPRGNKRVWFTQLENHGAGVGTQVITVLQALLTLVPT